MAATEPVALNGFAAAGMRWAARQAYRGGRGSLLPIVMYHRVLARPDPLLPDTPDARLVEAQLRTMSAVFKVMPLDEAVQAQREGRLPERALCITFDDGYRDNYEIAMPLMRRYGLNATVFIASGFLDGGMMFNDVVIESVRRMGTVTLDLGRWGLPKFALSDIASRVEAAQRIVDGVKYIAPADREAFCAELAERAEGRLPGDLMMTSEQVRSLVAHGHSVGGHTISHPILNQIDEATARAEIAGNRAALASLIGRAPSCFAYPNGKPGLDYTAEHVALVRDAGYAWAFSTVWGICSEDADPWQLPRFGPREAGTAALVSRVIRMRRHKHRAAAASA